MGHELAELRKMWKRKVQQLADIKDILEAAQRQDTTKNIVRYVEDRTEKKVNRMKCSK